MSRLKNKMKLYLTNILIYICSAFPIKKNKVFFFSYYGSQYGCNPKYISEYMVNHYPSSMFDIVWAFNDVSLHQEIVGIRKVKTMSMKYFYELCTAKVIITNFRTTDLFKKRKNQYYIQTWHSSLRLKQVEKDAEKVLPVHYVEMAKNDSKKCNLIISGCRYSTDTIRRAFWYEGEIFEKGTPRNDVLVNMCKENQRNIKNALNINESSNVILYAPTFRRDENLDVYRFDYSSTMEALKRKFGGDWVFLLKLHPHLLGKTSEFIKGNDVIDVTDYGDIQELLSISNVLITDYSSLMFDFAITKKPCFLYVPDLYEYTNKDRKLYFKFEELPFIPASDSNGLCNNIENFTDNEYKKKVSRFSSKIGSYEKGESCEKLTKHIEGICT